MTTSAERGLDRFAGSDAPDLRLCCAAILAIVSNDHRPLRSPSALGARIAVLAAGNADTRPTALNAVCSALDVRFTVRAGWRSDLFDAALSYCLVAGWLVRDDAGFAVGRTAGAPRMATAAIDKASLRFGVSSGPPLPPGHT